MPRTHQLLLHGGLTKRESNPMTDAQKSQTEEAVKALVELKGKFERIELADGDPNEDVLVEVVDKLQEAIDECDNIDPSVEVESEDEDDE